MSDTPKPSPRMPSPSLAHASLAGPSSSQASPSIPEPAVDPDALDAASYLDPEHAKLLPPPNFSPFFTVIEDNTTGDHYHPSVHYIFADDDQEILTAAAVRELGYDDADEAVRDDDGSDATIMTLPPRRPGVKERYVILDMAADGQTVAGVQSMSREWQVTNTQVRPAPTWDEVTESTASALMIKIGGTEIDHASPATQPTGQEVLNGARHDTSDDLLLALENLAEKFETELAAVTRLIANENEQTEPLPGTRSRAGSLTITHP